MPLEVFDDAQALSRAAARALVDRSRQAFSERRRFALALAGGTTPKLLYGLLASEFRDELPWQCVHLFWSDERYVSRDDPDSNYRMAREVLLDAVALPSDNLHPPEVGLPDPDEAARRYEQTIRNFFAPHEPRLDWTFLGLGEDGHVASLFPGSAALEEERRLVVAVRDSPKPPPVRLTMTLPLINGSREVHFLVSGEAKHEALAQSHRQGAELPAQRVRQDATFWWVDRQAIGVL